MAVFRVERTQGYTVMSNYHLRDKSLSLKAKGLLSQMLSLPEDWDYTLSGLAVINRESKDAIRSAVKELEKSGYIKHRQTTDYLRRSHVLVVCGHAADETVKNDIHREEAKHPCRTKWKAKP